MPSRQHPTCNMHAASQHAQHSADRMTLCTINADSCATARVFADEPHHHQYPYTHRQYPYSLRACLQTSRINGDLAESRPPIHHPRCPDYPQGPALRVPKADTGLRDRRPPRRSTVLGVRLCEVRANVGAQTDARHVSRALGDRDLKGGGWSDFYQARHAMPRTAEHSVPAACCPVG